jgi:DmsE family decaheme c-type cytochrome
MRVTRVVVAAAPLIALALLVWPSSFALPPSVSSAAELPAKASPPEAGNAYVGSETCQQCHEDSFNHFAKTRMGRLFLKHPRDEWEKRGCESCHGPGKAHVDAGGGKGVGGMISFAKDSPTPVSERNAICLRCHEGKARLFWEGSPHDNRKVGCTDCHLIMRDVLGPGSPGLPRQGLTKPDASLAKPTVIEVCRQCHLRQAAQQMNNAHMPVREGKMDCTSCHNPHGTVTEKLLKANSLNDTCFQCHADKRGPFLWEHSPVVESCANCHSPHGSNHENMLLFPKPRLCQQCHIEQRHPTSPQTTPTAPATRLPGEFIAFRACVTCHRNIHGSNHPSGYRFTR